MTKLQKLEQDLDKAFLVLNKANTWEENLAAAEAYDEAGRAYSAEAGEVWA